MTSPIGRLCETRNIPGIGNPVLMRSVANPCIVATSCVSVMRSSLAAHSSTVGSSAHKSNVLDPNYIYGAIAFPQAANNMGVEVLVGSEANHRTLALSARRFNNRRRIPFVGNFRSISDLSLAAFASRSDRYSSTSSFRRR